MPAHRFVVSTIRAALVFGCAALVTAALPGTGQAGQAIRTLTCPAGEIAVSDGAGWVCRSLPPLDSDTRKIAFVTSLRFTGALGGLAGADATCQTLAETAGLPGDYRAWLSDSTQSPATRFRQATVPYVRTDGVRIANNWFDLTSCGGGTCLQAPLNVDENEAVQANGSAWTATQANGEAATLLSNCQDWTSDSSNTSGRAGDIADVSEDWTDGFGRSCQQPGGPAFGERLYCFQQ